MKRTALASLAVLALLLSLAGPVTANGVAQGKNLDITLQGLPATCPTGATMTGELIIQLADDGTTGRRLVTVDVTVDTPFGDATVLHATFKMAPGTKRMIHLSIPVSTRVPTGEYYFDVSVAVKGEALSVGHEVYVYNGK